jgi:hypothetical protein
MLQPIEMGYIEYAIIEPLGKVKVKLDTGNGAAVVLHSDKYEIKDKKVI